MTRYFQSLLGILICFLLGFSGIKCVNMDSEDSKSSAIQKSDTNDENRSSSVTNPNGIGFGEFSGEILPVFYVSDVIKSVTFYHEGLGFNFNHFWDYSKNEPVYEWTGDEPPVYAQMGAGAQKFALHLYRSDEELTTHGLIHYFGVQDVEAHYRNVQKQGIETSSLIDRPWMRMFSVRDPDGHRIFFFTRPSSWIY